MVDPVGEWREDGAERRGTEDRKATRIAEAITVGVDNNCDLEGVDQFY